MIQWGMVGNFIGEPATWTEYGLAGITLLLCVLAWLWLRRVDRNDGDSIPND